jgi:N-acyl homoserine lactone hydrolase
MQYNMRALTPEIFYARKYALQIILIIAAALMTFCSAFQPSIAQSPKAGIPSLPVVVSPRLYILDCGTLIYNQPESFGLSREEVATSNMSVSCFLVIHPKGILLFDTGLSDALVGKPFYQNVIGGYGQLKLNTLRDQLAEVGVTPDKVTYLALSHSHYDHVGNANDYAGSTWLARKAEADLMFGPGINPRFAKEYSALGPARKLFVDGDYDVFGDGSVVLISTPGHTPGHQSLFVKLAHTGGVVVAGDLYHYSEERSLNRMPQRERSTQTPASRAAVDAFVADTHSQLWIGHSIGFFRDAVKSPAWYD